MRSLGKFTLGFGMVVIPVQLYNAVSTDKSLPLHQVRRDDGSRIRYVKVAAADERHVPEPDITRGYEAPDGRMVVLSDQEIDNAYGEKNRAITMQRIIVLSERPGSTAHDATYYVQPLPGGEQAYAILAAALEDTGQAVEVTFMLKQRESYGLLYAADGILRLERLVYPARVNAVPFEAPELPVNATPMIKMAQALLANLPQGSDWANQTDRTLDALTAAVEAKLGTGELTGTPEPKPVVTQAPDLMASLTASVEAAKAARGQEAKPRATRKSTRKAVA